MVPVHCQPEGLNQLRDTQGFLKASLGTHSGWIITYVPQCLLADQWWSAYLSKACLRFDSWCWKKIKSSPFLLLRVYVDGVFVRATGSKINAQKLNINDKCLAHSSGLLLTNSHILS